MKKGSEAKAMELCLPCLLEMEKAGYEARSVSLGMVVCAQCGKRCWGGAYRMRKGEGREAEA